MPSVEIVDDPKLIYKALAELPNDGPVFLNIKTQRKVRHTGAKLEGTILWNREKDFTSEIKEKFGLNALDEVYSHTRLHIQKIFT